MSDVPGTGTGGAAEKDGQAGKGGRRGLFPRVPLSKVLSLVNAIRELGHDDPVPRLDVYNRLNRKDGGPTRSLVAAANSGYGLTTGNSGSEVLGLSELGLRVAAPSSEKAQYEAILAALLSNEIFAQFVERYKGKPIPSDGAVMYYLKQTHGLSEKDAEACWNVMKANLEEYGPTKTSSGKLYIVSAAQAVTDKFPGGDEARAPHDAENSEREDDDASTGFGQSVARTPARVNSMATGVQPQFHFNIQVVLPENASPETYEAIFKNIGKHLLRNDVQE